MNLCLSIYLGTTFCLPPFLIPHEMNHFSLGPLPPKRRVIQLSVKPEPLPGNFFADAWPPLHEAVESIFANGYLEDIEGCYRRVERVCVLGFGKELAVAVTRNFSDIIDRKIREIGSTASSALEGVLSLWIAAIMKSSKILTTAFLPLDRSIAALFYRSGVGPKDLNQRISDIFADILVANRAVCDAVIKGAVQQIDLTSFVLQTAEFNFLDMLKSLKLYHSEFEPALLENIRSFSLSFRASKSITQNLPEWLQQVNSVLSCANSLVQIGLLPSTVDKIRDTIQAIVVTHGLEELFQSPSPIQPLVSSSELDALSLLYGFSRSVDKIDDFAKSWTSAVKAIQPAESSTPRACTQHSSCLESCPSSFKFLDISALLSLRRMLANQVSTCFDSDPAFLFSLKEAMEYLINKKPNQGVLSLVRFFGDSKNFGSGYSLAATVSVGPSRATSAQSERFLDAQMLEESIQIFRALAAKDLFEAFYRRDLARRLLTKSSSGPDERRVIDRLKLECGAGYVSKLETILKDAVGGSELTTAFTKSIETSQDVEMSGDLTEQDLESKAILSQINFTFTVITSGVWPTGSPWSPILYPQAIATVLKSFESWYCRSHSRRAIQWMPNLGHCLLSAGQREILCQQPQGIILMNCFQGTEDLSETSPSLATIQKATGIPLEAVIKFVGGMVEGKIMEISSTDDKLQPTTTVRLTPNLPPSPHQVVIRAGPSGGSAPGSLIPDDRTFIEDRQFQIDAAIVRYLKIRQQSAVDVLARELAGNLLFPVSLEDLWKRLESLKEREYVEIVDGRLVNYLP